MTTNETNPVMTIVTLAAIAVGGYLGYATAFPSDRKQVRSCISTMLEASRGSFAYGDLRSQLSDLNKAEAVVVLDEERLALGANELVTIRYSIDGRSTQITCGQYGVCCRRGQDPTLIPAAQLIDLYPFTVSD